MRVTEVGPRPVTALACTMAVIAAIVLAVSATPAQARSASPFGEIHSTLHNLFAPPRRARVARAKHPKQATLPARQATLPARSRAAKAAPPAKPDTATKVEEVAARQVVPSRRQKQASERSAPVDRAIPQPPKRPPEAPPRRETTARSTAAKDAPATDANGAPPAQRAASRPQREKTAALPPTDKGAAGEPEPAKDSPPPDQPPPPDQQQADQPPPPSACQLRLPDIAAIKILPAIANGACTAEEVVRLEAVTAKDGRRIAMTPPATLRCPMAESVVHWIRDEVASVAFDLGAPLKSVTVDTSFECRSRNHVAGAKLSEHGHANAVDLRAFTLTNGVVVVLTDKGVQKEARERLRETACTRFTTVLGPGSDGYHETHIHIDLAERRSGYRICQWDVHDPAVLASVPLPPERPPSAPPRPAKATKSGSRD
ncbi:MAG: extensin family protein [Xanthobacteraceae bacterium]